MKIYTKTGDTGETGLLGGARVSKNHDAIEVCGGLDETNSFIGLARSQSLSESLDGFLDNVQKDLFVIGSQVAGCTGESKKTVMLHEKRIESLELMIDEKVQALPPMDAFILPGGHASAAALHVARSVCRRSERRLVSLTESGASKVDLSEVLIYLNRLGDFLFVLARCANADQQVDDVKWLPDPRSA